MNWKGGIGQNIEDDCVQEITNKIRKNIVKRMGSNKTIKSIGRVCKAVSGIKEIVENYSKELGMHSTSTEHTTTDSKNDEVAMITDLLTLKPFTATPGRAHRSFAEIKRSPLLYLNVPKFHEWLDKHKREISLY